MRSLLQVSVTNQARVKVLPINIDIFAVILNNFQLRSGDYSSGLVFLGIITWLLTNLLPKDASKSIFQKMDNNRLNILITLVESLQQSHYKLFFLPLHYVTKNYVEHDFCFWGMIRETYCEIEKFWEQLHSHYLHINRKDG